MTDTVQRILLIDDADDLREVLSVRLRAEGYEVTSCATGKEGVEAALKQPPDLILLDMIMPDQDGMQTYQALRANASTRQLPVILMTSMALEAHWEALPYDTDGPCFVTGKPQDLGVLLARISQLLAEARNRG